MLFQSNVFMPYKLIIMIWAALLLASGSATVSAQEARGSGKMILVLDASGSMWGQIDGEAKIVIARRVIDDLLETLPDGQLLGLTVYGHREKGNCRDIETLVAPGPDTREAIRSAVNGLNPRGKTPLSDAVIAAAEALKFEEDAATVVLVSDGRETCERDPCEVGRRLAELGVDLTAHVVGFDVAGVEAQSQLQCLAEATGGRFLTAADAGELSEALEQVSAPTEPETFDIVFEATDGEGGRVLSGDLVWTLVDADAAEVLVEDFDIASLSMALASGRYTVEVMRESDEAATQRSVEVTGAETYSLALAVERPDASVSTVDTVTAGATVPVQWTGPDEQDDYITVSAVGAADKDYVNFTYTVEGSPLKLRMPPEPGEYEIRYIRRQSREILASQPVTVEAVRASVSAPKTASAGETVVVRWTGPDYKDDHVTVSEVGSGANKYVNYTYTKNGSPLKLVMPPEPGDYEVRYIQRQGRKILASQSVTVEAVEARLSAPEIVSAGEVVAVEWTGPDYKDDYITVSEADTGANQYVHYTYTREGSPLQLAIPSEPGDYEIRYIQRQGRVILARQALVVE